MRYDLTNHVNIRILAPMPLMEQMKYPLEPFQIAFKFLSEYCHWPKDISLRTIQGNDHFFSVFDNQGQYTGWSIEISRNEPLQVALHQAELVDGAWKPVGAPKIYKWSDCFPEEQKAGIPGSNPEKAQPKRKEAGKWDSRLTTMRIAGGVACLAALAAVAVLNPSREPSHQPTAASAPGAVPIPPELNEAMRQARRVAFKNFHADRAYSSVTLPVGQGKDFLVPAGESISLQLITGSEFPHYNIFFPAGVECLGAKGDAMDISIGNVPDVAHNNIPMKTISIFFNDQSEIIFRNTASGDKSIYVHAYRSTSLSGRP